MKMPTRLVVIGLVVVVLVASLWLTVRSLLGGDRIRAAIEAQATAAIGRPVTIQTARPHLFPRVGLALTGITIGTAKEVTVERATLTTGLRAIFRRRVEDARVVIERSQIDVRWALALLAAFADSGTPAAPTASSMAFTIDSISALALRDVVLVAGNRTLRVDMDSSLTDGDRLVITRMDGQSDISDFRSSGELTSIEKRTGKFSIDAATLDLDGLLTFLVAATPAGARQPAAPGSSKPPPVAHVPLHVDIGVRARQGRALGATFTKLATTGLMRGGDVSLEDLDVGLFGGRHTGGVAFRSGAASGRYEWRGAFENLDVPQLVTFAGATGSMTGKLAGTVSLAAAGVDPQQAIQRARGTARITITDGQIPGLDIVRSVVLAFGKPSGERPPGSGEAFDRVAATLAVNGPVIITNDLAFASRDFDMTGQGTLSLASQAIDFRTDIVLSPELSAQAGRDLYRLAREGERIVLPARITGTVASPTVVVDVQAALQRALRNRAEDELKSLFDRFRKKLK
jgi:uncharacterized protein involved in outer membrane biogenesis